METAESLVNIRCVVYFNIYLFGRFRKEIIYFVDLCKSFPSSVHNQMDKIKIAIVSDI